VAAGWAVVDLLADTGLGARCIQIKDAIIKTTPSNASMFRVVCFLGNLRANISPHILIVNQGA
jgi:hypothetical protein